MTFKVFYGVGLGTLLGLILLIGLFWLTLLHRPNPLGHTIWRQGWWPVACTTRGCITTRSWARQQELATAFAAFVGQPAPNLDGTLTTLIRQHLAAEAGSFAESSPQDAKKYREEVLQLTDEALVLEAMGIGFEVYDQEILVPLLQQEALKEQRKVESLEELFVQLSGQRRVWVLLNNAWWDPKTARIVRQ